MRRDPESEAARAALDAIITAKAEGKVEWDAVSWVSTEAFEQFRKDARAQIEAEWERTKEAQALRAAEKRRDFWAKIWGI